MTANRSSLLAHLAGALAKQTEVVATKSLAYILGRSEAARSALAALLRTGGADVGAIERVADEVAGEEGERVDVVGTDRAGSERVLIEAKFWAGLTDNQPGTYLRRLPNDGRPAVLLFVAPELRLRTLWPHVTDRAMAAGFRLDADTEAGGIRSATVAGSDRRLMLTSWRALLGDIASRANVEGDGLIAEDVRQLVALCERQDTDAFVPLRSDELSPEVPRRLRDLRSLIDTARDEAAREGFANKDGLNVRPRNWGYGAYLRLGSDSAGVWAGAWLGVHDELWLDRGHPLWIRFDSGKDDLPNEEVERRLGCRGVERQSDGALSLPIELPIGKEYAEVLDSVVDALREAAQKLAGSSPPRSQSWWERRKAKRSQNNA